MKVGKASEISWQELKEMIFALKEQGAETDRRFQETDRRFQETDRLIRELREDNKETDRRFKETDRQLKRLGEQIGGIGDKFGYFAEGMALPSMEKILRRQFKVTSITPRVRVRKNGTEQEYDVIGWSNKEGEDVLVVVEVKSRVKAEAIGQLKGQIEGLFEYLPEHRGRKRVGILAGVDWDTGVQERAQAEGLYTAVIRDDVFKLTVPKGFRPRVWS